MRIGGGGSQDINLLQSDSAQFRNEDFIVSQGGAFMAGLTAAAVAAEYSHVQLFNPAASGVTVMVDAISASPLAAMALRIAFYNTAFANSPAAWVNLLSGASAGNAVMDEVSNATPLGTGIGTSYRAANGLWDFRFDYPPQLGEGEGILVVGLTVNQAISATFWGREV